MKRKYSSNCNHVNLHVAIIKIRTAIINSGYDRNICFIVLEFIIKKTALETIINSKKDIARLLLNNLNHSWNILSAMIIINNIQNIEKVLLNICMSNIFVHNILSSHIVVNVNRKYTVNKKAIFAL